MVIIPRKFFNLSYHKIIYKIQGILTPSEKKVMIYLNRCCYDDGLINPKLNTIADKISKSTRHTRRIINGLEANGFLRVVRPALVDKRKFSIGNSYHILYHNCYDEFDKVTANTKSCESCDTACDMACDLSPDIPIIIKNKSFKEQKNTKTNIVVEDTHIDKQRKKDKELFITQEMYEAVNAYNKEVSYPKVISKSQIGPFDKETFIMNNKDKNQDAVMLAVNTVLGNSNIKHPAAYANKIVLIQSPNYNERQSIDEHQTRLKQDKKALVHGIGKEAYLKKLGYNFDKPCDTQRGIEFELKRKKEQNKSIDERNMDMNVMRNRLFEVCGC